MVLLMRAATTATLNSEQENPMIPQDKMLERINNANLNPHEFRALAHAITQIQKNNGVMQISVALASMQTRMHSTTYRKAMRELVAKNYLTVELRPGFEHHYQLGSELK